MSKSTTFQVPHWSWDYTVSSPVVGRQNSEVWGSTGPSNKESVKNGLIWEAGHHTSRKTVDDSMLKTLAKTCHIYLHEQHPSLPIKCQQLKGGAFAPLPFQPLWCHEDFKRMKRKGCPRRPPLVPCCSESVDNLCLWTHFTLKVADSADASGRAASVWKGTSTMKWWLAVKTGNSWMTDVFIFVCQ